MIRRGTEEFVTKTFAFPAPDKTAVQHHLVTAGEFDGKMNSFVRATLNPGFEIPFHVHDDCEEIFTLISGHAKYIDGARNEYILSAGDVVVCRCGEGHSIGNPFTEPAIVIELNMPVDKK